MFSALVFQHYGEDSLEPFAAWGNALTYIHQRQTEEALLLLRPEVQEPGICCAIIEAIAGGATRSNEIAAKTGENASKCLKYINTLCELGILYRDMSFGEKATTRKSVYCISDEQLILVSLADIV